MSVTTAVLVVITAMGVITWVAVGRLDRRIDQLAQRVDSVGSDMPMSMPVVSTTLAPPLDLPPADADVARRRIIEQFRGLFSESSVEQRAERLSSPSDLPQMIQALTGGPCAGTMPVITRISFVDDDHAAVSFRFDGPSLSQFARGFSFDGAVVRSGDTWLIDPVAPAEAVRLGESASACG